MRINFEQFWKFKYFRVDYFTDLNIQTYVKLWLWLILQDTSQNIHATCFGSVASVAAVIIKETEHLPQTVNSINDRLKSFWLGNTRQHTYSICSSFRRWMVQVLGDDLKSGFLPLPLVLESLHKGNVLDRNIRNKQTILKIKMPITTKP